MSMFPELTSAEVEAEKARIAAREAEAAAAGKRKPIIITALDKAEGRAESLAAEALRTGRPLQVETQLTPAGQAIADFAAKNTRDEVIARARRKLGFDR